MTSVVWHPPLPTEAAACDSTRGVPPFATEAAAAGFYDSDFWKKKFPRLQIITIDEMLSGKRPDIPWGKAPFAKAPTEKEKAQQESLL